MGVCLSINYEVNLKNSWYIFIIAILGISFFIFIKNLGLYLLMSFVLISILFFYQLKIKDALRIFLYSGLFALSYGVTLLIFPAKSIMNGQVFTLFNYEIYKAVWDAAIILTFRVLFVSFFSLTSFLVMDFEKMFVHFMSQKILSVRWGYPILIGMNSINLLKSEFERIKINARMRGLKKREFPRLFFTLLVFAIKHSERGSLSLITRGINEKKLFYFNLVPTVQDKLILVLFIFFYFTVVSVNFLVLN